MEGSKKLSKEKLSSIKLLFPEKYQQVLAQADILPGHSQVGFEITFRNYRDLYRFILMFDEQDFPKDKIPRFEIGICATCPKCGQLNMSDGMDFGLIKVNQQKLLETIGKLQKDEEVICWCLLCLMDYFGSGLIHEMCKDSTQEIPSGEKKEFLH